MSEMAIINLFSKTKKRSHFVVDRNRDESFPSDLMTKCDQCKKIHLTKEFKKNLKVCPSCNYHHKMTAVERIACFLDEGTFISMDDHLQSANPLNFPAYIEKVQVDMKKTGLNEAVLTGEGLLKGQKVVVAVMDAHFRMGSMGSVVGEKITRAVEQCLQEKDY